MVRRHGNVTLTPASVRGSNQATNRLVYSCGTLRSAAAPACSFVLRWWLSSLEVRVEPDGDGDKLVCILMQLESDGPTAC